MCQYGEEGAGTITLEPIGTIMFFGKMQTTQQPPEYNCSASEQKNELVVRYHLFKFYKMKNTFIKQNNFIIKKKQFKQLTVYGRELGVLLVVVAEEGEELDGALDVQ